MTILKGRNVNLRPPVQEDVEIVYEWMNDQEIMMLLGDEVYRKFSKIELGNLCQSLVELSYDIHSVMIVFGMTN